MSIKTSNIKINKKLFSFDAVIHNMYKPYRIKIFLDSNSAIIQSQVLRKLAITTKK